MQLLLRLSHVIEDCIWLILGICFLKPVVDPKGMTEIIIKALKETKQRGIIYKGWGGIGDCEYLFYMNLAERNDVPVYNRYIVTHFLNK